MITLQSPNKMLTLNLRWITVYMAFFFLVYTIFYVLIDENYNSWTGYLRFRIRVTFRYATIYTLNECSYLTVNGRYFDIPVSI